MKQIVQNYKTGKLEVMEVPVPHVRMGMVLVQNAFSLISPGTERASIEKAKNSLLQKAKSRPEDLKRVLNLATRQGFSTAYRTAMERLEMPVPLGYSSSGFVLEIGEGVTSINIKERVACAGGGYASHSEVVLVPENLCARIPEGVPLDWAAFTTLGAIALQGIRQGDIRVGENVCVIGLGLLGQLTIQILKASGCRVFGIDIDDEKIKLAQKNGADFAFNVKTSNLISDIFHLTSHAGVDVVIITAATESNDPFLLAPKIARDRAKIVLVGVAKIDFPREPYYRKELSVILSRSYGPGRYDSIYEERGIDYPIGYVRWTEKRNMEAVLNLMAEKKLNIEPLISHRFKIENATEAYDLILGKKKERFLGILFEYEIPKEQKTKISLRESKYPVSDIRKKAPVAIGFIGVGNFARTSLLPNLKYDFSRLVGVADIQPHIAKYVAQKYGFEYCTSDYQQLLNDEDITTIFIATRHNLHARFIIESLSKGKNTFCEKPLCLNNRELGEIIKVYNQFSPPPLFVIGFNRRFAPLTIKARELLGKKTGLYIVNYRINAGKLPLNHWVLDANEGGGRIIGEVCHFIDYISFIVNANIESIYAESLNNRKDNIVVTLKYADGSVGSISYFEVGDKDFPKERVEIFGDDKVCIIDDYRELIFSFRGKTKRIKRHQDKGHKNEIIAFFEAIVNSKESPIPFESIVETTRATFAIIKSIETNKSIKL